MYVRDKTKLANIMKRHLLAEQQKLVDYYRQGVETWLKENDIWGKSLAQLKQLQNADKPKCKTCKGVGTVRKKWGQGFRNEECPAWGCDEGEVSDSDYEEALELIIDSGSIEEWMKSGEGYIVMDYQNMVYLRDKIRIGNYYEAEAGTHLDTIVRENLPYDLYAILTQLSSWCENDIAQRNPRYRAAAIARAAYRAAHQKYISIMGEGGYDDKQIRMYDELSDAAEEKANMSWDSECEVMHRTPSALNNCRICGPVAGVVNNPKLWSDSVFWNIYETLKEHNRPRSQVVRDFKAVLNEYDWSGTELGFNAESFAAESWGGDPDGQLAQALARARSQPRSSSPVEITELPKVCAECGGDSPQAFGLFDENRMISEAWFCDSSCADKNLSATQISFGADEKKNPQVKCPNCSVGYLTDIPRYERVRNKPLTCDSCRARFELCDPTEIQRLKNRNQKYTFFGSESEALASEMVITENSSLPDPVSWIIWLADPMAVAERERSPKYAELFFVRGPGQRVHMEDYRRTAEVNGVYGAPFMITQNTDERGWLASTVTIRNFTDREVARSLSVGDIVEDSETGTMWIVAPVGYYQLEPASDTFSAPLPRHPLDRFKPRNSDRKSASYWRKRGKDAIFRPERTE
jgi:hypothetical protein